MRNNRFARKEGLFARKKIEPRIRVPPQKRRIESDEIGNNHDPSIKRHKISTSRRINRRNKELAQDLKNNRNPENAKVSLVGRRNVTHPKSNLLLI